MVSVSDVLLFSIGSASAEPGDSGPTSGSESSVEQTDAKPTSLTTDPVVFDAVQAAQSAGRVSRPGCSALHCQGMVAPSRTIRICS